MERRADVKKTISFVHFKSEKAMSIVELLLFAYCEDNGGGLMVGRVGG